MRTQREFLEALAKERNGWNIVGGGICRGQYCVITAVAKTITGEFYEAECYREAAEAIELPAHLAERIATANDDGPETTQPRLRKRILAALGLSEATS